MSLHSLISLKKPDFLEYVKQERSKASYSMINIAGDMSWLNGEKEATKKLIEENPNINIKIYYDRAKITNPKISNTIEEYKNFGVKMIEYPFSNVPHLKALIIDNETEDPKFLVFKKKDSRYLINIFRNNDIALNFAKAFIGSIDSFIKYKAKEINKKRIIIGISGLNNIGKTTLVSKITRKYNGKTDSIPDTFIHESKSSFESAALALCNQFLLFLQKNNNTNSKLLIFDRTPIDNLAFLYVNQDSNSSYKEYTHLIKNHVSSFINDFDFIVLLKQPEYKRYTKTTHLEPSQRKKIKRRIENLYNDCYKEVIPFFVSEDSMNYKQRLEEISNDVIKKINDLEYSKSLNK